MSGRPLNDITRQDQTLARLSAAAHELMALDRAFKKLIPPAMGEACRAVRIRDDELVIHADNGIVAARLRMTAPGLLPQLAQQGYPASKVRVKVALQLVRVKKPKTLAISETALDGMEAAADSIGHPEVRRALARLIAHQRRG
ncbi:DciA family protein [Chromobacterium vaccinii]|uniref:DciA family protein n=1 Tax=Chromobacterium vaccinii TaxID=1108595 RepID=A0ABV0F9U9_9NEIS